MSERLPKELMRHANSPLKDAFKFEDTNNLETIQGTLLPSTAPYNKGAFKFMFTLDKYPNKPPIITCITPIYHPNVGEDGKICPNICLPNVWKPGNKLEEVIREMIRIINEPEEATALRPDLYNEYKNNRSAFISKADDYVVKHALKRS